MMCYDMRCRIENIWEIRVGMWVDVFGMWVEGFGMWVEILGLEPPLLLPLLFFDMLPNCNTLFVTCSASKFLPIPLLIPSSILPSCLIISENL